MKKIFKTERYVKEETGEIVNVISIIPEARDKDFVKVFKTFSEKFLKDLKLINGEAKLFLWFLSVTIEKEPNSEGWIFVDYEELAKELDVTVGTIKNYIKRLLGFGYIEQKKKRQTIFRIVPEMVYKGYLWQYKQKEGEEIFKKEGAVVNE